MQRGASTELSKDGVSPLAIACSMGKIEIAKLLLDSGVELNISSTLYGDKYASPLHASVYYQRLKAVEFLIEQGADLELRGHRNRRPLEIAIECENMDITRVLVNAGTILPAPSEPGYQSFIDAFGYCGKGEVIKYLVESTSHSAYLSHYGYTPLYLEIISGDIKNVMNLLEAGESVNQFNQWEQTPLMIAASLGQKNILSLLLEWKAEIDVCDEFHYGALTWAGIMGDQEDLVQLLLQAGADPNLYDDNGSVLTKLAARGAWKSVKILLQFGAHPGMESEWENSILIEACLQGKLDVVKQLFALDKGVDPYYGPHPLEAALKNNHFELADYLLHHDIWKKYRIGKWATGYRNHVRTQSLRV